MFKIADLSFMIAAWLSWTGHSVAYGAIQIYLLLLLLALGTASACRTCYNADSITEALWCEHYDLRPLA